MAVLASQLLKPEAAAYVLIWATALVVFGVGMRDMRVSAVLTARAVFVGGCFAVLAVAQYRLALMMGGNFWAYGYVLAWVPFGIGISAIMSRTNWRREQGSGRQKSRRAR